MHTHRILTTTNAYGEEISLKFISLGTTLRKFVISRLKVNYFQYLWRFLGILLTLGLFVQVRIYNYNSFYVAIGCYTQSM